MKTNKKILILNYEFPPLGGGASPVSYEIAKDKIYKPNIPYNFSSFRTVNMLPGNHNWLPDDFFFRNINGDINYG